MFYTAYPLLPDACDLIVNFQASEAMREELIGMNICAYILAHVYTYVCTFMGMPKV